MAKDKGGKAAKGSNDFAKPSDAPATGGDGFKFESEDNAGTLFLITPLREETVVGFENKDTVVIVADIVAIDEKKPEKSVEHVNAYVFGGWTKGALRGYMGQRKVLARLEKDKSKGKGANAAWVLEDADKADEKIAIEYLESVDPFAVKGAKAADEKPAKKDKGGKSKPAPEPEKKPAKKKPAKKKSKKKPAKKKSKK